MATDPQRGDIDLRTRVRELIQRGWLPRRQTGEIAAGYGSGAQCAACEEPIKAEQVEYEVEDQRNSGRLRFHLACHAVWLLESGPPNR
jgi:hypothetical protein